jgi:hypothetical protein
MSNIAGKAYAMNLLTPIAGPIMALANKLIFWLVSTPAFAKKLDGLKTLSMIHFARWVIVRADEFPHLEAEQPREELKYSYMFFFSNFNGSWAQYVDSFSAAIPTGLDLLWWKNVGWPKSVPEQPFHRYVNDNQLYTNHYYNAYPMAASNDVKSALAVKGELTDLARRVETASPEQFLSEYNRMLRHLQHDLGELAPTPIVSLAAQAAHERCRIDERARPASERMRVA